MATIAPAPKGNCLVARAIPADAAIPSSDVLSGLLSKLTVGDPKCANKFESTHAVTPSDFRDIQNIRSSALAKKTKTAKFQLDGVKLYADLTPPKQSVRDEEDEDDVEIKKKEGKEKKNVEQKSEQNKEKKSDKKLDDKEKEKELEQKVAGKDEKENEEVKDGELLGRGPVQNVRVSNVGHHPYQRAPQIPYGCTAQTPSADISAYMGYGSGYECGSSWSLSPDTTIGSISASTTPDTVLSSEGYGSSSPQQISPKDSPFSEISSADTSRVLTPENNELPENLQDFILQYSNQYTREDSVKGRPPSADSGVCSPMSARSAPNASPQVPQGTCSGPTTPSYNQTHLSPRTSENGIVTAKQRLQALIPEHDQATGLLWGCTIIRDLLKNRDSDGDTPLHIVVAHHDHGKIFGLCETLKKTSNENEENMFNVCNNYGETPLYVSVIQRNLELVEYFLECGASPNGHSSRALGDTPLHFAASRGMVNIVRALLNCRETDVNSSNDGGQTPFMCAVKMHGMIDEDTHQKIDNRAVLSMLLEKGADPGVQECGTGKTIVHLAIDKQDVELIDHLSKILTEESFVHLATTINYDQQSAVEILGSQIYEAHNSHIREALYIRLLVCGVHKH
ncbi:Protein CBG07688 [Caenorhabditis briggsae]|uniref:Protein CBG07688 n=1 Tax=Caenorhabditis briggsae TaxID=6238 RepID=A8X4A5_CAEBR|nr:Protein CBG07688 [Caenorhabditis briggsae]CAP27465.2 Protein CBG07688 [Caenorhabditis briggsae]